MRSRRDLMLQNRTINTPRTNGYAAKQPRADTSAMNMTVCSSPLPLTEWQRVRRFLIVGATSTVLDFLLLVVLKAAGGSTLLANTLAFSIATVYNFAVSRRWTYAGTRRKHTGLQFAQFAFASLLGLLLNDVIVLLLETPLHSALGGASWSYLPAKFAATGAVAVFSFVTNRIWIFDDVR
jgi:putative flippase GtrA